MLDFGLLDDLLKLTNLSLLEDFGESFYQP